MILSRLGTHILLALTLMPVIVPDRPAEAITRIGNASATIVKVNNNKLAESRVGNGRTIDRKPPKVCSCAWEPYSNDPYIPTTAPNKLSKPSFAPSCPKIEYPPKYNGSSYKPIICPHTSKNSFSIPMAPTIIAYPARFEGESTSAPKNPPKASKVRKAAGLNKNLNDKSEG